MTHPTINIKEIEDIIHSLDPIILDNESAEAITVKGAADYVTKVDTAVQEKLRSILGTKYPEIGFISEEQDFFNADTSKSWWILDPIDGTTNLIHHFNLSAVSLGLYENGEITYGIVYNPFTKETFTASKGCGSYLNGKAIHVSKTEDPGFAIVAFGSSPYERFRAEKLFKIFLNVFNECADFRRTASAALDLCYVASGRVDCYIEQNLKPWDYAAGSLILKEAGGDVGTWIEGESLPYLKNSDICASNPNLTKWIRSFI